MIDRAIVSCRIRIGAIQRRLDGGWKRPEMAR
jgi:hypothetical protein